MCFVLFIFFFWAQVVELTAFKPSGNAIVFDLLCNVWNPSALKLLVMFCLCTSLPRLLRSGCDSCMDFMETWTLSWDEAKRI